VVISRSVDVGQTVAASFSAPTLFTIAEDLKKMQVDTSVSEGDVGRLTAGTPVTFTVDAFPAKTFTGTVRQIRNSPTTVSNVVTYDAVVDVENPELELKPGMTANATFVVGQADNVLRVPNAALRFKPPADVLAALKAKREAAAKPADGAARPRGNRGEDGAASPDRKTVWKLVGTELVPVRVKVGLSDGASTEILDGKLAENDTIVTGATGGAAASSSSGGANRGAAGAGGGNRGGGMGGPRGPF
jgi:HlyD family secretion protein